MNRLLAGAAVLLVAGGCASTSPAGAFDDVARTTAARSGHRLRWDAETPEDAEAARAVDRLLAAELTSDAAVQVGLLTSPRLRATFEELSIAQADLVQAGLLKNPVFTVGTTAWESEHISPNLFASVEQDFLDIVTMPLRKRVAQSELDAKKLEVGDEVLELASQIRTAFFRAQAASQVARMRALVDDAAQVAAELARRQHEAGNMSELALGVELGLASQTHVDRVRSEGEAVVLREELNKRMGVVGARTRWRMSGKLPELPPAEAAPSDLESAAVVARLDVGAARGQVEALDRALTLAKTTRWTGTVTAGLQVGRLRGSGRFGFGPQASIEIPLFDQRRAAIAKLEAMKRQAERHLDALVVDVQADVRSATSRVTTARGVVDEYRTVLVPARERVVRLSQQQYDAMLLGVYQLLAAKQAEYESYREYIESLRDYWIARSDLERAVGRRIGTPPVFRPAAAASPPPAAPDHSHHHHGGQP